MSATDLERMRFAYSPLAEVAESLLMLACGHVQPMFQGWFDEVQPRLANVDTTLLTAVVPDHPYLVDFMFAGATDPTTTIEDQLALLVECPPEQLRSDLEMAWKGYELPEVARVLIDDGAAGIRRLADTIGRYWSAAIEPYWRQIRAVLDDDVAYRATRLTKGGIEALLSDLHPEVSLQGYALRIDKPRHTSDHELAGAGLLLVPSVFTWPHLIVGTGESGTPSLTYGPRGVGALWEGYSREPAEDDALGALLGRSRAAILISVALPHSTTELAFELGQSAPAVSAHLSVLRRSGLVTSWRSGRRVLYQRTQLATSIITANEAPYYTGSEGLA